jgi:hypothetical protein
LEVYVQESINDDDGDGDDNINNNINNETPI